MTSRSSSCELQQGNMPALPRYTDLPCSLTSRKLSSVVPVPKQSCATGAFTAAAAAAIWPRETIWKKLKIKIRGRYG